VFIFTSSCENLNEAGDDGGAEALENATRQKLSAKINGEDFSCMSYDIACKYEEGKYQIMGHGEGSTSLQLDIYGDSVGTYIIESKAQKTGAGYGSSDGALYWKVIGEPGEIEVTELTDSTMAGTFHAILCTDDSTSTVNITNGIFDCIIRQ